MIYCFLHFLNIKIILVYTVNIEYLSFSADNNKYVQSWRTQTTLFISGIFFNKKQTTHAHYFYFLFYMPLAKLSVVKSKRHADFLWQMHLMILDILEWENKPCPMQHHFNNKRNALNIYYYNHFPAEIKDIDKRLR